MHVSMRWLFPLLVLTVASCGPSLQDQIDAKEQLWTRHAITNYQIEVSEVRSIWHAQTYSVTVREGAVSEASASCIPAPFEGGVCQVEPFDPQQFTIPGLFAIARSRAQASGAEYLTIQFHDQYGFPERISLDDPNALDDDVSWTVRDFGPLS